MYDISAVRIAAANGLLVMVEGQETSCVTNGDTANMPPIGNYRVYDAVWPFGGPQQPSTISH